MKKRILSLLLVLVLLVTVSAFAVEATEVAEDPNPTKTSFDAAVAASGEADTLEFHCEACGGPQTWTKGTIVDGKLSPTTGHVYIPSTGLTNTKNSVWGGPKLCLYLNGDWTRNIEGKTSNAYLARLYKSSTSVAAGYQNEVNIMGNGTAAMKVTGKGAAKGSQHGAVINTSTMLTAGGDRVEAAGEHTLNIYEGVVIDASGADVTVDNRNGAALAIGNVCGTINMYGGTVIGGMANYGGAVFVTGGDFNMYGGTITGSTVKYGGGAVHVSSGKFTMEGGTINGGEAPGTGDTATETVPHGGGAVHMSGGTFDLKGGNITGGTAVRYAGAVLVSGIPDTKHATLNMSGGTISGGKVATIGEVATKNAWKMGGNVAVTNGGVVNMTGGTISNDTETKQAWMGGNVLVNTDSTFIMNGANARIEGGYSDRAGGIGSIKNADVQLLAGTITGGRASNAGGCLFTESANTVLDGATIENGTAQYGGCVGVGGPTFTIKSGTISGGKSSASSTKTGGGNIAVTAGGMESGKIGAVVMEGGTIENGTLFSTATGSKYYYGGNVFRYKAGGTFEMQGGTITGGHGGEGSLTIYRGTNVSVANGCVFTMTGGEISDGHHAAYGANVFLADAGSSFVMDGANAKISGGTDYNRGGVVVLTGTTFELKAGTITGGKANTSGAAVMTEGTFTMTGGKIIGGEAPRGGAVHVGNGTFTMNGEAAVIEGGKATYGGNIMVGPSGYVDGKFGEFILNAGTIQNGEATEYGGNVYIGNPGDNASDGSAAEHMGIFTMNGGVIQNGTAKDGGGNVIVRANRVTAKKAVAEVVDPETGEVTTPASAAEYRILPATFTMTAGTISGGNATDGYGGNVVVHSNSTFTMNGAEAKILDGTTTTHGGNVYIRGEKFYENNAKFILENGTIAGGVSTRSNNSSFGGNVCLYNHKSEFTMNGGLVSAVNPVSGAVASATNGVNIGAYADSSVVNFNGGEVTGGTVYYDFTDLQNPVEKTLTNGGVLSIGSIGVVEVNMGGTKLNSETREHPDIFITGGKKIEEGVYQNVGKLNVLENFDQDVFVAYGGNAVLFSDETTVSSDLAFVEDGYANAGSIVLRYADEQIPVVASGSNLVVTPAAVMGSNGNYVVSASASAQAAVDAVADGQYVKLFHSGAELTLTKATTVDFNGKTAIVNGAENLLAMDAATNDYDATDAAKVTLNGAFNVNNVINLTINGVSGQRKYVALQNEDGSYSFHRYYITMRNVGLRVTEDKETPDLIFSATFRGTEGVAKAVTSFGIDMKGEGAETAKTVNYMDHNMTFEAGKTIYGKSINLLYKNDATVTNYGDKNVTATAFIQLGDIRLEVSEPTTTSLKAQVEHFAADYANQSETGKAIIDTMLTNNADLFNTLGWTVTKQEEVA